MADNVEEIKSRLGIVEVVSQYVQLKKAGVNYKGLCPFHSEKSPSFVVSPEKQICHCFGCNKGGDIFSFIQEVEGVDFVESMKLLADRAGVKLDEGKMKKGTVNKTEKEEYFKAHDLACDFFEKQLWETNDGKKVMDYLYRRGLKDETIKEFRLGFAPESYDALHKILLAKGISKNVLVKSGLAAAKNLADGKIYDKYRTRLIFPIFDYLGRVAGFGGRALKNDQMPKYLNSPENPIYNKSKLLYGLSHAKKAVKEKNQILMVEGYFDVILPYQAGIKNVSATSGTALTADQVKLIKRITKKVVTCFDSDNAGFEATKRAYFLVQNAGLSMKTVSQLEEKDPADYVREHGEEFKALVNGAPDFVEFFIEKLLQQHDVTDVDGRRKIIAELLPCFQVMQPTEKDYFVRLLSSRLGMKEGHIYEQMETYKLPVGHPARGEKPTKSDELSVFKIGIPELVLGICLEYPKLFKGVRGKLDFEDFAEPLKDIYKALSDQYNSARDVDELWKFDEDFFASNQQKVDMLLLYVSERYQEFSEQVLESELEKLIDKVEKDRRAGKLKVLQKEIHEAENQGDKKKVRELLEAQQALINS
jgi:DNA primase